MHNCTHVPAWTHGSTTHTCGHRHKKMGATHVSTDTSCVHVSGHRHGPGPVHQSSQAARHQRDHIHTHAHVQSRRCSSVCTGTDALLLCHLVHLSLLTHPAPVQWLSALPVHYSAQRRYHGDAPYHCLFVLTSREPSNPCQTLSHLLPLKPRSMAVQAASLHAGAAYLAVHGCACTMPSGMLREGRVSSAVEDKLLKRLET